MSDKSSIPDEWYFITAPQSVSWEKQSRSKVIDTYGTNNPYVNYGSTSLRNLTLGDAMLEGFSDAKEVESNVTQLENCMRMVIDEGKGFTAPYCWHVFAGEKSYGTFIINSVSVEESMRDMTGKATRATVSVDLQEVSPYQVTSGIDITSTAVVGGITPESEKALTEIQQQEGAVGKAKGRGGKGGKGGKGGAAGPGGDPTDPDSPAYTGPQTRSVYESTGFDDGYAAGRGG